jgi:hypothetical protein
MGRGGGRTCQGIWGKMNKRNIVLTGLGRSGTTLTCYLLNKLPNTVALSEPIAPSRFAHLLPDTEAVVDGIEEYYRKMRRMARKKGVIISKHVGGVVPDNTKGMVNGERRRIAEKGKIAVGKNLEPGFWLAIKDVNMFSMLLPTLTKRFPCYAIVRNPLAIMASLLTLTKVREASRPSAKYDEELTSQVAAVQDPVERKLKSFHLRFERYLELLPEGHIIRYEDLVRSRGKALKVMVPAARKLDEPLESMNLNSLYDRSQMLELGERLLKSEGAYWHLYERSEVEELLAEIRERGQ